MRAHTYKVVSWALVGAVLLSGFLPFRFARGGREEALAYLRTRPAASAWVTMALAAAGETVSVEYLKTRTGTTALEYEAPILALAAAGEDPRTYPNENFVARLKSFSSGGQIGDPALLNDDIFSALALVAAGEPLTDPVLWDAKETILAGQQGDGSWSYGAGAERGDTNTTAAAMMALVALGVRSSDEVIVKALGYLRDAQNDDGGFPYDPASPYGRTSDASSDAWVISALTAAGETVSSWQKNGKSPADHLHALQQPGGYFVNQAGAAETGFTPTETAYALIAILGKWYPVRTLVFSSPLVSYRIEGSASRVCIGEARAQNPLELVRTVASDCGTTYAVKDTSYGPYLERIGVDAASGMAGWIYTVNETPSNEIAVGAGDYELSDGDSVLWYFGEWTLQLARLMLSATSTAADGLVTARVEGRNASGWLPLSGASVRAGGATYTTGDDGTATLSLSDGAYGVFAERAGYVRTSSVSLLVGAPASIEVPLIVTLAPNADSGGSTGGNGSGGDSVAFTVREASGSGAPHFGFEGARRGDALKKDITIENNGMMPLALSSEVSGDELFRTRLTVRGVGWRTFALQLPPETATSTTVGLTVPVDYRGEGTKTGSLTLWATPL